MTEGWDVPHVCVEASVKASVPSHLTQTSSRFNTEHRASPTLEDLQHMHNMCCCLHRHAVLIHPTPSGASPVAWRHTDAASSFMGTACCRGQQVFQPLLL